MNQPPISNDVLLEKMQGFFDLTNNKIDSLRNDLSRYEGRLTHLEDRERIASEWHHTHDKGPSHPDIQRTLLEMERKLGALDSKILGHNTKLDGIESKDDYNAGVQAGRAQQLSTFDKVFVAIVGAIPTGLLLYSTFVS